LFDFLPFERLKILEGYIQDFSLSLATPLEGFATASRADSTLRAVENPRRVLSPNLFNREQITTGLQVHDVYTTHLRNCFNRFIL
jgi:hypothetical protein